MVKTYDPKQVSVVVGGKIMHGFVDGTFVKVGRSEDMWKKKTGVDGEGTRAKSNDKSGFIEITLMNSSSSNDDLSGFTLADELSNTGAVPAGVKDLSGRSVAVAATAWVVKWPDHEDQKEAFGITWRMESDEINIFIGGN